MSQHESPCSCDQCVAERRCKRTALTPQLYPSTFKPTYSALPIGETLCQANEDLEYYQAMVRAKKADIKVLMDCAVIP